MRLYYKLFLLLGAAGCAAFVFSAPEPRFAGIQSAAPGYFDAPVYAEISENDEALVTLRRRASGALTQLQTKAPR